MTVFGEACCSNTSEAEVGGPGGSNSRDGDTHNANFIVRPREESSEAQRKENLSKTLGVSGSQEGKFIRFTAPELEE